MDGTAMEDPAIDAELEYVLPLPAEALGLRTGYVLRWLPGLLLCSPHQVARDWELLGPNGHMRVRKNGTVQVSRPDGRQLFVIARKLALAARFPNDLPEHLPVARVAHRDRNPTNERLENLRWIE